MGTISIRKTTSIPTPLAGRANLAVKADNVLYIKDENGVEYSVGAVGAEGGGLFTVSAVGGQLYQIAGFAGNFPTLTVVRGQLYYFNVDALAAHPFALRLAGGNTSTVPGTTNNDPVNGKIGPNTIIYRVPFDAPASIVYQCTVHASMIGIINIVDQNGATGPGELGGTHYLFVKGDGTDIENAQALQSAYDEAKLLLQSSPITQEDAITILVAPGLYNFVSTEFELDTEYINVVALNSTIPTSLYGPIGNFKVSLNSADPNGTIFVNSNNVYVYGIDAGIKNFRVGDNLQDIKIESCSGGDLSFGGVPFGDAPLDISGTFINCQGGDLSFAGNGEANGTFIGCQGGDESFGYDFASGTFVDCVGGDFSFAFAGIMTGIFQNCSSGEGSFGTLGAIGFSNTRNCQSGNGSFGFGSFILDSAFEYCTGGEDSFGFSFSGTNEGKFYNCRLTTGTFDTPTSGGFIVLGIDGNNTVQNITGI